VLPSPQARPVDIREILGLAVPAALSTLLGQAFRVIDQYAVQWLGVAAQAAVGATGFVVILFFAFISLISAGAGPLMARAVGAGDARLQRRVLGNALTGIVGIGAVTLAALGLGAEHLSAALGISGEPAVLATTYMRALAVAGLPLAVMPVVDALFIARGNTITPMLLQGLFIALNVGLNWLFIYEMELGIAGAGYASGAARAVALAIGLTILWRQVRPDFSALWPDETIRRVLRVGFPIAVNVAAYTLVYWALLAFAVSPLGPEINAALGIGFAALEGCAWPVFYGLSLGIASVVGRRLGAGEIEEAKAAVRLGLPLSTAAGLTAALVFRFAATPLCALFTEDPIVLEEAIRYAHILAWSQLFVAWEALAEGTLEGSGDTRTVLWWSAPLNIARIPLAVLAAQRWGPAGIWWTINATTMAKAAGKGAAVIRGRWAEVRI